MNIPTSHEPNKIRVLKYQGTTPFKQIGQMVLEETASLQKRNKIQRNQYHKSSRNNSNHRNSNTQNKIDYYINKHNTTGKQYRDKNAIAQIIHSTKDKNKVLIVGDFNAHHRYWGDDKTDRKGEIILEKN